MAEYDITYAEEWKQKCPTCECDVVLTRPKDQPHHELYGTCSYCNAFIAGFIHVYGNNATVHVIDLLREP